MQRDGKVGLEMAVVIPAKGRDAIAGADAEGVECAGKAAGPMQRLGVRGAVEGAVGRRLTIGRLPKSVSARRAMAVMVRG